MQYTAFKINILPNRDDIAQRNDIGVESGKLSGIMGTGVVPSGVLFPKEKVGEINYLSSQSNI